MHSFSLFATTSPSQSAFIIADTTSRRRCHKRRRDYQHQMHRHRSMNERETNTTGPVVPCQRALFQLRFVRFISYIVRERRVRVSRSGHVQNRKVGGKSTRKEKKYRNGQIRLGVLLHSDTKDNTNNSSQSVFYAKKSNRVEKAQWTGIVTSVALEMLRTKTVDCVVAVGSREADARNRNRSCALPRKIF